MSPVFKKRTKSPQINLAVSMDNRTNNEALNIQDGERLMLSYVENADLFNTLTVQNRNGTEDLSNGIINSEFSDVVIIDNTVSGIYASGTANVLLYPVEFQRYDYPAQIIIPSGDLHLTATEIQIYGFETALQWPTTQNYVNDPFIVKAELFTLDQSPLLASGSSFMAALPTSSGIGNIYDIGIGGNFVSLNTFSDFYPKYENAGYELTTPIPVSERDYARKVLPLAIAEKEVSFAGRYVKTGNDYLTSTETLKIPFSAPVALNPSGVYAIRYSIDFSGCSSTSYRSIYVKLGYNTTTDITPNTRAVEEFLHYKTLPSIIYEKSALRGNTIQGQGLPDKAQIIGKIYGYSGVNFLNPDYYTSSNVFTFPAVNGKNPMGGFNYAQYFDKAPAASIGQTLFIPSGINTFFGCYGYFGLKNTKENWTPYNADGTAFTSPKNIGIAAKLWTIDSSTGTGGNYEVTGKTLIASCSGNMIMSLCSGNTFAFGNPSNDNYFGPSENLQKQYFTFDNPVTISGNDTVSHLLTFDLYDTTTGGDFYDYVKNSNFFYLPIVEFGAECNSWQPYSGVAVVDYSGIDQYKAFSGTYANMAMPFNTMDLTCGLIDVPSGNCITLIYDYRVGSDLNQKVIIGQRDKLYYTYYANPDKSTFVTIHSGATVGCNLLWNAVTSNDLLFAHHYAADNGQVWASNYTGVSYDHGKRPTCTASGIGAAGTFTDGDYKILLATSMQSGGFRASEIHNSGSGIHINANESIHISNLKMEDQYPFDINDNSTYIFITENSGSTFYLANLLDAVGGGIIDQPIQNNQTDVYIDAPPNISVDENVAGALTPSYPQRYLTTQIDTPQFKKILMFYNYMIGIGDVNYPSTFYHSEILGPQIWGHAGDYHGSYDINPDNGQQITAAEVFGQWLIIYKKNSTFKVNFLGDGGIPFEIIEISPNIGNLGIFSTVSTEEGIFGLSQYGPTLCNGNGVEVIGKEIYPWFKEINHDDLTYAYAIHDLTNNTITWSIGNDNQNTDRNYSLVLNYKEKSWSIRQGASWNCAGIIRDADGFDEIWMGDSLGTVRRDNVGNTDEEEVFNDGNGIKSYKTIQLYMETPWMSFKDFSTVQKQFRFLNLNTEQADAQLQIDVYFDYATTPLYSRLMDLSVTGPNRRINLGSRGKVVKFAIYNVGNPAKVKINSMMIEYQPISEMRASQ